MKRVNSRKLLWCIPLCLCCACLFLSACGVEPRQQIEVTAHRGNSATAPENTIPAFEAAIIKQADYVELDVKQTKDGVLVILHDDNLTRTTGEDRDIWDVTYEELKQLEAGAWFSKEYEGTRIPTLEEALKYCKGKLRLNIEVKHNGRESSDFVEQLVRQIEQEGFVEQCLVTSFNYEYVERVKAANPEIVTGFITADEAIEDFSVYTDADCFSIHYKIVTDEVVTKIHAMDKKIHVWTVNETEDIKNCVRMGVDNIITNDVEYVRETIK